MAGAAFFNAGQDCTAASRVLVEQLLRMRPWSPPCAQRRTRLGPVTPSTPSVTFGPLISQHHLEKVEGLLAGLPGHARVVAGGCRVDRPGFFLQATVVTDVDQGDEIVQEEIFGPVITVQAFTSEAEALSMANDVTQGLCASIWTRDHGRAERMCRGLDFGTVSVNTHAPTTAEMPHGGFGGSGYGKDLSLYGLEDYTRLKHVASAW